MHRYRILWASCLCAVISISAGLEGRISADERDQDDARQELREEIRIAKQEQKLLQKKTKLVVQKIDLLKQKLELRDELNSLDAKFERAEQSSDQETIEDLESKAERLEIEIENQNVQLTISDFALDLVDLEFEVPADSANFQAEFKQLEQRLKTASQAVEAFFNAIKDGQDRDEEEPDFEELLEDFEREREIFQLRIHQQQAQEEGDDEWLEEIADELREFGVEDEFSMDSPETKTRPREEAVPFLKPIEVTDEEISEAGQHDFHAKVLPLLQASCFSCHDEQSAAGDLNLEKLVQTQPFVVNRKHWLNVIQQLKLRSMPPQDADQPSQADRRTMIAWLTNAIVNFDYRSIKKVGRVPARRLTHEEYNNTIRDLFGVDLRPADQFPLDMSATSGFDNSANSLFIQPLLLERYLGAAEWVVNQALPLRNDAAATQLWQTHIGSKEAISKSSLQESIKRFADRAFRRPVSRQETQRLTSYYQQNLTAGKSPKAAYRDVIEYMLVSPHFLLKSEAAAAATSSPAAIDDFALANRLSYFLWATMPDDRLFQLATARKLSQSSVLKSEVNRMLNDQKSRTLGTVFASQWLGFGALSRVPRSPIDNPWMTESLLTSMQRESAMLFSSMIDEDASISRLLNADYTYLNEELAKHYEIPNVRGSNMRRVALTGSSRRGVLGHGSILAVTSFPGRTSPVVRGNWILSELLGTPPPPPPPNVSEFDEQIAENDRLTARQKLERHRTNPNCYTCHSQIDPLGFALERFEWFGRYRPRRGRTSINVEAKLPGGRTFEGLKGLSQALWEERRDDLMTQVTRKMLAYALGRQVEYYDEATVIDLVSQLQQNDGRLRTLIHGIVQSDTFRQTENERL